MSAKSRSRALSGSSQIEFQNRGGREGKYHMGGTLDCVPVLLEKPKKVFPAFLAFPKMSFETHCPNQVIGMGGAQGGVYICEVGGTRPPSGRGRGSLGQDIGLSGTRNHMRVMKDEGNCSHGHRSAFITASLRA